MAKLTEQNIVVLGSLNPAILHPNWLGKIGLIPEGEKVEVKIKIGSYFPGQFQGKRYQWTIDHSKLQVNVLPERKYTKYLGDFISKVFENLSHTPVTGIGENFTFEKKDNLSSLFLTRGKHWEFGEKTNWGPIVALKHDIKIGVDDISNIAISEINDGQKTYINFNFHYDAHSCEKVIRFANEVEANLEKAEKILKEIGNL